MSVEIAWKQNILVTDFHLLKPLLVVFGFGSQAFVCGFSRQNINSVVTSFLDSVLGPQEILFLLQKSSHPIVLRIQSCVTVNVCCNLDQAIGLEWNE